MQSNRRTFFGALAALFAWPAQLFASRQPTAPKNLAEIYTARSHLYQTNGAFRKRISRASDAVTAQILAAEPELAADWFWITSSVCNCLLYGNALLWPLRGAVHALNPLKTALVYDPYTESTAYVVPWRPSDRQVLTGVKHVRLVKDLASLPTRGWGMPVLHNARGVPFEELPAEELLQLFHDTGAYERLLTTCRELHKQSWYDENSVL